jgi:hypothetical protein
MRIVLEQIALIDERDKSDPLVVMCVDQFNKRYQTNEVISDSLREEAAQAGEIDNSQPQFTVFNHE